MLQLASLCGGFYLFFSACLPLLCILASHPSLRFISDEEVLGPVLAVVPHYFIKSGHFFTKMMASHEIKTRGRFHRCMFSDETLKQSTFPFSNEKLNHFKVDLSPYFADFRPG